ncbi:MAG: MBL fold metallo-hydrolase [Gemmatimonadaceae bacterium]|nr:MBL fold metallo-hydrolase [Gemmatimonadaceae bacterium]
MRVCTLASGSKANATLVESGGTRLLIDCGLGPRVLAKRLGDVGVAPTSIDAVVITHEHIDHVRGLTQAVTRWPWPVIATAGTLAALPEVPTDRRLATAYLRPRAVGECTVELVAVPHDAAEPAAVLITAQRTGARAGVATDLGHVPDALGAAFERLDYLVFESNHDEVMLRTGPYPPYLQARIASQTGHLSNRQAGGMLTRIAHKGLRQILLAHLSQQNNEPQLALAAARDVLKRTGFRGVVGCATQDGVSWPDGAREWQGELAL